jgi:hypothetical protein
MTTHLLDFVVKTIPLCTCLITHFDLYGAVDGSPSTTSPHDATPVPPHRLHRGRHFPAPHPSITAPHPHATAPPSPAPPLPRREPHRHVLPILRPPTTHARRRGPAPPRRGRHIPGILTRLECHNT